MSMIGYYDGTAVRVNEPLQMNRKTGQGFTVTGNKDVSLS